jgi:hypothetical protein
MEGCTSYKKQKFLTGLKRKNQGRKMLQKIDKNFDENIVQCESGHG